MFLCFRYMKYLIALLDCADVNVRCAAGEGIALMHEIAREYDEDWDFQSDELEAKIKSFLSESQRYYKKEDRKQQKSSFRDILHTIEVRMVKPYNEKWLKLNSLKMIHHNFAPIQKRLDMPIQ